MNTDWERPLSNWEAANPRDNPVSDFDGRIWTCAREVNLSTLNWQHASVHQPLIDEERGQVERIYKIEDGTRLEDDLTYRDEHFWSKPARFRVRYNWRPDAHLMEYACEQFSGAFGRGYDSVR